VKASSVRNTEHQKITYTTRIIKAPPNVCQKQLVEKIDYGRLQKGNNGPKTPISSSLRQRSQQFKTLTPRDSKTVTQKKNLTQHNLNERRRRNELNHLFTELHNNIPSLKGCKASNIKILSTATKYIAQLKSEEQLLLQELNSEKLVNIGLKIYVTNQKKQQNSSENIHS